MLHELVTEVNRRPVGLLSPHAELRLESGKHVLALSQGQNLILSLHLYVDGLNLGLEGLYKLVSVVLKEWRLWRYSGCHCFEIGPGPNGCFSSHEGDSRNKHLTSISVIGKALAVLSPEPKCTLEYLGTFRVLAFKVCGFLDSGLSSPNSCSLCSSESCDVGIGIANFSGKSGNLLSEQIEHVERLLLSKLSNYGWLNLGKIVEPNGSKVGLSQNGGSKVGKFLEPDGYQARGNRSNAARNARSNAAGIS